MAISFAIGVGGRPYHWTESLYPALAMHALINALSAGTVFEGWQLPVAMVFSVALTLAIARLIAMRLGDGAMSGQGVVPAG